MKIAAGLIALSLISLPAFAKGPSDSSLRMQLARAMAENPDDCLNTPSNIAYTFITAAGFSDYAIASYGTGPGYKGLYNYLKRPSSRKLRAKIRENLMFKIITRGLDYDAAGKITGEQMAELLVGTKFYQANGGGASTEAIVFKKGGKVAEVGVNLNDQIPDFVADYTVKKLPDSEGGYEFQIDVTYNDGGHAFKRELSLSIPFLDHETSWFNNEMFDVVIGVPDGWNEEPRPTHFLFGPYGTNASDINCTP